MARTPNKALINFDFTVPDSPLSSPEDEFMQDISVPLTSPSSPVQDTRKVSYYGHNYVRRGRTIIPPAIYYNCEKFLTRHCQGKLIIKNGNMYTLKGQHSCISTPTKLSESLLHTSDESSYLAKTYAIDFPGKNAKVLVKEVYEEIEIKYKDRPHSYLNLNQLETMVYNERKKAFGNYETAIMSPPLCYTDNTSDTYLLLFNNNILITDKSNKQTMQKFIGWGHPDLAFHLRTGALNLFIDCTFSVVPKGFSQLFVLMAYIPAYDYYLPIYYVLMQSKCLESYKIVLSNIVFQTDWRLQPKSITSDFEQALMTSLQQEFGKEIPYIACEFHWKQAIRRKLIGYNLPLDHISKIIGNNGYMEILCIIPIVEIIPKGIPYVRFLMKDLEILSPGPYDSFWKYFTKTWMVTYNPLTWNIHDIINRESTEEILINRTNNAIERQNRTFQEQFKNTGHPTIIELVEVIQTVSKGHIDAMEDIKKKKRRPTKHMPVIIPVIPDDYILFTVDDGKSEEKEKPKVTNRKK